MQPLAAFVPLAFAAVSGSRDGEHAEPLRVLPRPGGGAGPRPGGGRGAGVAGSAAGRTMSPVAAVTLMCATLTGTNPFTLAKRVAVPLLVGVAVVVLLRLAGVLNPLPA